MKQIQIEKLTLNIGAGTNQDVLNKGIKLIKNITGKDAVKTTTKKRIPSWGLRPGLPIGCKVTLRGDRMYEFLDRFINIALPRVRDFRGVSKDSFDGRGNFAVGIKEQIIFPEIDYDKVEKIHGMDIVVCTSAKKDEEARTLLEAFGMPYRR